MNKAELKLLASRCLQNGKIDEKKAVSAANFMDRKTLKIFIRELKMLEKQNSIYIALPDQKSYNDSKDIFIDFAKGKSILFEEDPNLIAGLRITQDDMVFEQSLTKSLDDIISDIDKNYN